MRSRQEVFPSFPAFDVPATVQQPWPSIDSSMNDNFALAGYFRIIWNHRWLISAITMAVFLATLFGTIRQKPVFRATGSLQIDLPKGSVASLGELFQDQAAPDGYMQTQAEILRGSAIVSLLIAKIEPTDASMSPSLESVQEHLENFKSRLSTEVVKGSHLIQVDFESESAEQAAATVNQLMAIYIDQTRVQRSQTAQNASSWLLDQLNQTKQKLEQATSSLQRYENDHQLLFVQTADGGLQSIETQRLQELQSDLTTAERLRIEKGSVNNQAQSGYASVLKSPLLEGLLTKETEINQKLSQLDAKFGPNFPEVKQIQDQLKDVQANQAAERLRIRDSVAADYSSALRQENLERAAFDRQQKIVAGASQQLLQDGILKRDVDLYKQLYEGLLRQMDEAGVSSQLDNPSARVMEPAQIPITRIRPNIMHMLVLGFFTGLTLAVTFVFLQEHFQDTFQSADDVAAHLNLPLLGVIPAVPIRNSVETRRRYSGKAATLQLEGATSIPTTPESEPWFRLDRDGPGNFEISEAIRNLRTSLLFSSDGSQPRSILISSALPSEGKSTVTANLSVALAQLGKRVLSIDGDMRRPSLHRIFSMSNKLGLADYLKGNSSWQRVVSPTVVPGLSVIVSGGRPRNPAELLSSDRMEDVIRAAQSEYDIVLVDSPTLLNMADSRVLASYVDAVLLIVKSGDTPKKLVKQAFNNLRTVSAKVVGVVLNHADMRSDEYSFSDKHYGSDNEASNPPKNKRDGENAFN